MLMAAALPTSAAVTDSDRPAIETGAAMLPNALGKFAWLDAHTLAITTFAGDMDAPQAWMSQQVIAFDARTRQKRTIVAQGRVGCTNPAAGVANMTVGDTRVFFRGSQGDRPPASRWFKWEAAAGKLAEWPDSGHPDWNASLCRQTLPEDVNESLPHSGGDRLRLYLQPGEGFLTWQRAFGDAPQPVRLQTAQRSITLDLTSDKLGLDITHLPFARAYLLTGGLYRWTEKRGEQLFPALLLKANGQIERMPFPADLAAHFTARRLSTDAPMVPVAGGILTIVTTSPGQGGGLYLTRDGKTSRIWFANAPSHESFRIMSAIEISPDGCRLAFDARWPMTADRATLGLQGSVKIIELCSAK